MDNIIIILLAAAIIIPTAVVLWTAMTLRNQKAAADRMRDDESHIIRQTYERQIELLQHRLETQADEIRRQARIEFEALANEALDREKERLQKENTRQLDTILSPLREKLSEFNRTVTDSYVKENATRQSLADQIERLMRLNHTISEDARNLTKALKGDSKVQGDWGETILEGLLQKAGMKRDINYSIQLTEDGVGATLRDAEGNLRRPDVVVYLPQDRTIVIDSKVSLTAFAAITEADTEEKRNAATRRHVESVKRHINELAAKRYQNIVKNASEHVLMFMPNEGAYFAAVNADPTLWDYAFKHNVVIVSPTHLFSVMQLISQIWRGEKQNRNAAEIARLGGLIYDKVAAFTREMDNILKGIHATESAYDNCLRHLTSGPTSIMARTRRLQEMGAKTTGRIGAAVEKASAMQDSDSELPDETGSLEE